MTTNEAERAPNRVDVHAHYLPETYRGALIGSGHGQPDGMAHLPDWDENEHVAMMDRLGIAMSYLSVSSPGVWLGDDASACHLARQVNEEGCAAARRHPGRFGMLASLPLPDIGGTLEEIRYCCDELAVAGFVLMTNADGKYVGDPEFEPVFDELDFRSARVLIHPTSPPCWEQTSLGRPRPVIESLFDTTRAVINMVLSGTVGRHPKMEVIVPHAGAALPILADRIAAFTFVLDRIDPSADVERDLARLHHDLAGFPIPRQLDALLALTTAEHLHYGSDYPFTPEGVVTLLADAIDGAHTANGPLPQILAANSLRLFA